MPKSTKKVVKKAAKKVVRKPAKKAAKKTIKRSYSRKPKVDEVAVQEADVRAEAKPVSAEEFDRVIREAFGEAQGSNPFTANSMLDMTVRDRVQMARGEVVTCVRELIDMGTALHVSANRPEAERNVLLARQKLAVAEFELAMDNLETTIRG